MCRLGGITAALLVTAVWLSGVDQSFAQAVDGAVGDRFLLFSGFDLWRRGDFVHGGLLWSPNGLTQQGFTLKTLLSGGSYRYPSGTTEVTGDQGLAAVMPGWRFKNDHLEASVFAGLDLQHNWLIPDDPGNRLRGTHVGARAGFDLWYQPSDMLMATVSLSMSASPADSNIWGRAAVGLRVLDCVWLGPEVVGFEDHSYSQWRLGIHATAFRTGNFEWSVGIGYARDSDQNAGPYGHVGLIARR
jgi:hypothetical protein